ncbi:two-component system sensor histidine kinase NtrB [Desulforhopalus singaporensis]|uniref:histidine kinase n=1 Tax=Desulforhopalus singaporensis TaxID=91360 RepID=A0A1H0UJF0_9BACT|nr:ATP-binding protein [Desulforhopalus singaporensis]SDP66422.1 His Kinase A (phospho-acceptor) domain-containing protein [Desulforhopalus singaporensis]
MAFGNNLHNFHSISEDSLAESGLGSFKLVKYFSFSSLGVILVFTLLLSWFISNNARKVMLEQNEEYSLLLAENLNQQVFRRFVLPAVIRYGGIALRKPEQFELLDSVIKSVTQGLKIDSVTIYDSSVNIISYSTVPDLVGLKDAGGTEYQKALEGIPNSRLEYSGTVFSQLHIGKDVQCELRTFIPFRQVRRDGEEGDVIMGVIEIEKDLSRSYSSILDFQGQIIVISSVLMSILFLVLRLIVSRAGEIIEKRAVERQKLEEKLNQAERLAHLGTMVATVSHEIKSPLGIVRSTAEILAKRIEKIAPGNEHLARIVVDETVRLNDIVVEFLDFARPQKPALQPGSVNSVVHRVLDFISPELKNRKVELVADLAPGLVSNLIDQELLYRALINIIVNSLQAMENGGQLQITTRLGAEKQTELIVKDSGIGMSAEKCKQIFKPFFTDKNKGTGLGLAITRNIVDGHHGEIEVASEENVGTIFTISLPPLP